MADELPPEFSEEDAPLASVVEESTPVETPTTPEPEDEEQYFIKIDKRNYAGELSRLEREDNHFKEVFRARIGQRAARVYKPQIESLEHKYNAYVQETARNQFEQWKQANPTQFQQELANNPQLARQYADVQQAPNPALVQLETFLSNELQQALENGLSDEKAQELYDEVFQGKYGDANIQDFAKQFRNNVFKATLESARPNGNGHRPPPPTTLPQVQMQVPQQPVQAPNPNLTGGAPVGSGTRGRPATQYTKEQVLDWQATNPERFYKEFPDDDSWDRAVASGLIKGMGPNS